VTVDALLRAFESLFRNGPYRHNISTQNDFVASYLYEDLFALGRSPKLTSRILAGTRVVNVKNKVTGKPPSRRGDGTFGEPYGMDLFVPELAHPYKVKRAPVATLEIGCEVKVSATRMLGSVDRVTNDMRKQAGVFRRLNRDAIRVGIAAVNHAPMYFSHAGSRVTPSRRPPLAEAIAVIRELNKEVRPKFDPFLLLRYIATNEQPYDFDWVNRKQTEAEYRSALIDISIKYERAF
jgi:hypothetical protein